MSHNREVPPVSRTKLCFGFIAVVAATPSALSSASAADGASAAAITSGLVAGDVRPLVAPLHERSLTRKGSPAGTIATATQRLDLDKLTPADFGDAAADDLH